MTSTPPVFDVDTAGRVRSASPEARVVHREVLIAFATTGRAPDPSRFEPAVLAELHERDLVRVDPGGDIAVAYPFSGLPTDHQVDIDGGPTVWAMCAIDALGIGAMLRRNTTVRSIDVQPVHRPFTTTSVSRSRRAG